MTHRLCARNEVVNTRLSLANVRTANVGTGRTSRVPRRASRAGSDAAIRSHEDEGANGCVRTITAKARSDVKQSRQFTHHDSQRSPSSEVALVPPVRAERPGTRMPAVALARSRRSQSDRRRQPWAAARRSQKSR